jgi:ABC-type branched-subunit amino acid transport system substrate-binding protein
MEKKSQNTRCIQKENGQSGIIDEEYAKIGGNDFRTTITKLKAQKVDAVFLDMVGDDPLNFVVQSKQLGFKPTIISYNGLTDAFANEKDKSLLEGIVIINWEITSPAFEVNVQSRIQCRADKSC